MGRNGQILREAADALGVSHHPLSRNAGRCSQCSSCPNGCRLDAKRAAHVSYLPRAVAAGARVRAGVEVASGSRFEGGRAVGVEGRSGVAWHQNGAPTADGVGGSGAGHPYALRARRAVILAGGAFGTPGAAAALRAFARPAAPLGRNLTDPPACWVGARFDDEVRGWDGVMQSYAVDEWQDRGHPARGDLHPARLRRPVAARNRCRAPGADPRLRPTSPRPASTSPTARAGGSGSPATARSRSPTSSRATTLASSPSGSPVPRSSSTPPARREVYPQIAGIPTIAAANGSRSWRRHRRPPGGCAWRRSTRWERPAWTPTPSAAWSAPTAPSTAPRASTSPTARCCRARSGSTR